MLVPAEFLYYQIKKFYPSAEFHIFRNCSLLSPILYDRSGNYENHLVYIGKQNSIIVARCYESSVFLCDEGNLEKILSHKNNCISFEELPDFPELFNFILSLFDKYKNWQNKMETIAKASYNYQALIDECDKIVDEPMAIVDTHFRYVAYSKDLARKNGFESRYVTSHEYLPLEQMNILTATPEFAKLERRKDMFQSGILEENILHINIFYKRKYVGRMGLLLSQDERKSKYYTEILRFTAHMAEEMYSRLGTFFPDSSENQLKEYLLSAINKNYTDFKVINQMLGEYGFSSKDEYCLVSFHPITETKKYKSNQETKNAFGNNIESLFPGTLALMQEKMLLLLVDLTYFRKETGHSFHSSLADIIRESLLKAGSSRYFSDMNYLSSALKQAEIALKYGNKRDPTYWHYQFDDYALDYLIHEGIQDFRPDQVCSLIILKLRSYDRQKGTELEKSLNCFLDNSLHISVTAQQLFISRSTFLKRLDRIHKLTNLNLNDPFERLYLELSFRLEKEINTSF